MCYWKDASKPKSWIPPTHPSFFLYSLLPPPHPHPHPTPSVVWAIQFFLFGEIMEASHPHPPALSITFHSFPFFFFFLRERERDKCLCYLQIGGQWWGTLKTIFGKVACCPGEAISSKLKLFAVYVFVRKTGGGVRWLYRDFLWNVQMSY